MCKELLLLVFLFFWLQSKSQSVDSIVWKKQNTVTYQGKQDDICFVNENYGWYGNGSGKMYKTTDGGNNWNLVCHKPGTFWRCVAFIDTLIGFAGNVGTDYFPNVQDTIPLYKTIDGGKTWEPVAYTGNYVKGLCAIDIVKEVINNHGEVGYRYHIYGVGRVGTPANIIISNDGGKTFTSSSMNEDCKMLFDIKMFNTKEGFVCAATNEDLSLSNALILFTKNGGKTWEKKYQSNRPFECTWKVSFPTRKVGYVTIQSYNPDTTVNQQRIAKTIDGGETWQEIDLVKDHKARQFGVGFIDENKGFVGTMMGGFETNDGGKTWNNCKIGRAANKIRIYNFGRKSELYAIGVGVYKANL
jgi:photosystem II stability/assembly factor-like uncharacterized protein